MNGPAPLEGAGPFAHAAGFANPLGSAVRNSFALAVGTGHGEDYVPRLSDIIAELNGLERERPGG